jgi:sodium transport system permease protein
MNWGHVHLIFMRELRDQLRDRRTMFTIAVLPLLLYPLMGMLMLQIAQFNQVHPVQVAIVGYENWPDNQPLIDRNILVPGLASPEQAELIEFERTDFGIHSDDSVGIETAARTWLNEQNADLVIVIPKDFRQSLTKITEVVDQQGIQSPSDPEAIPPAQSSSREIDVGLAALEQTAAEIKIFRNQANDQSQVAFAKIQSVLHVWQDQWVDTQLRAASLSPQLIHPVQLSESDIAPAATRQALIWSKLLPFVMLVWALTGAFYPAVDLCAGEKERGTLETLLSSPALRREIVWGKLLTVMSFSVGTAMLNLFSMQFTASFVMRQFQRLGAEQMLDALGPLPVNAIGWLFIMLVPISALFSALALAVAALARSSKEGQYYLMPLLLVGLPLVMLPMLPGTTLSLGTSIIPVTGAVLLSRALIEGHYHDAMVYAPFVLAVTVGACLLAVRWAVRQFESESVMFRESERFDLSTWLRRVWQDRATTASTNEAVLCGLFILVALFFGRLATGELDLQWASIVHSTVVIQIGLILGPCLVMAIFLTKSLREALRINKVRATDLCVAAGLAVCLHPAYVMLAEFVHREYAIGEETAAALSQIDAMLDGIPLLSVIFILAVIPAICEELAFRGFIFGGLQKQNGALRAILLSSLFFGLSHGVLQQSISAGIMGLVLGVIAWRSKTVLCGIVLHLTHNSLSMWITRAAETPETMPSWLHWSVAWQADSWTYSPTWATLSIVLSVAGMAYFFIRPPLSTSETSQREASLQKTPAEFRPTETPPATSPTL